MRALSVIHTLYCPVKKNKKKNTNLCRFTAKRKQHR